MKRKINNSQLIVWNKLYVCTYHVIQKMTTLIMPILIYICAPFNIEFKISKIKSCHRDMERWLLFSFFFSLLEWKIRKEIHIFFTISIYMYTAVPMLDATPKLPSTFWCFHNVQYLNGSTCSIVITYIINEFFLIRQIFKLLNLICHFVLKVSSRLIYLSM